jgi:transaldolase
VSGALGYGRRRTRDREGRVSNPLCELQRYGQAAWLDTIDRKLLRTGTLADLIEQDCIQGLTSNPSIFQKAICCSDDYDADIERLAKEGASALETYEALAVADIQAACDLLAPVRERTGGIDGWVSIEVRPDLAHDPAATVEEAKRLVARIGRDNLFVKIPGTVEGRVAMREMISEGHSINATLVFSPEHYLGVAHAYEEGLVAWRAKGGDPSRPNSVASLFVSRVDTLIDTRLEELAKAAGGTEGKTAGQAEEALALRGKIAIAGAKMIYQRFQHERAGSAMQALMAAGARVQRPLWASTSTKNPAYPDTLYVDRLIGPDTVNTLTLATIDAFRDHGKVAPVIEEGLAQAEEDLRRLAGLGISYSDACDELQVEGIGLFQTAFDELIASIEAKRAAFGA